MQGKYILLIVRQLNFMHYFYSVLVDQISTLVNDTMEKLNASDLLYKSVNITLRQLLVQQRDIENYASQVS